MMLPFLAAAIVAVANAPSSFSTMVERTVPCPVIPEPKVGMKFELDLPLVEHFENQDDNINDKK